MSDGTNVICTFDGTFDGFLSVIYYVVKNRIRPILVCTAQNAQLLLNAQLINVETDSCLADKVRNAINDKMGYDGFKRTYYAFLNSSPSSANACYKYLMYGLKYGKATVNYMSHPDILAVFKLSDAVSKELDRMKGFLRFSVMEGGVEYAPFEPVHDLLAPITPHFTERLRRIPFVIHDIKREKAAVYTTRQWFITDASGLTVPKLSPDEKDFQALWRTFYQTISIKERKNERLQTQMMPKMYRKHITEFLP